MPEDDLDPTLSILLAMFWRASAENNYARRPGRRER